MTNIHTRVHRPSIHHHNLRRPPSAPHAASLPSLQSRMRAVLFLALMGMASAMDITSKDQYQAEVVDSGKNAFVKFLAPW